MTEEPEEEPLAYLSGAKVRRDADGAFRVEWRGLDFRIAREDLADVDALLDVLTGLRRELADDDFVPSKVHAAPDPDTQVVPVRFTEEQLEILRERVRVGREEDLDAAVARAVRVYLATLTADVRGDTPAWSGQATLAGRRAPAKAAPAAARGLGTTQLALLRKARERGFVTRSDVGRLWGISARGSHTSGARVKANSHMEALVARGLLRHEERAGADPVWVLTATGAALLDEAALDP